MLGKGTFVNSLFQCRLELNKTQIIPLMKYMEIDSRSNPRKWCVSSISCV